MRFHVVRAVMFAAAAAVPLTTAIAQEATSASPQRARPGAWAFSLGLNSTELNLGTQRPGTRAELMGSIARHWNLVPRLDLRTQAVFGAQFPRALTLNAANGCPDCEVWSSRQFAGLNAAFVYQWRDGKAFSPYVLNGAEALVMRSRSRLEAPCAATSSCSFVDPNWASRSGNQATLGLTAGAGIAFRVRKTNLFGRVRDPRDARRYEGSHTAQRWSPVLTRHYTQKSQRTGRLAMAISSKPITKQG